MLRVCSEEFVLNIVYVMLGLVFDCKVEACGITSCSPCLLRIMLRIVLHVDLMRVSCLLRRSSSSVVSVLKKFIV